MESNIVQLPGLRALFSENLQKERDGIERQRLYNNACNDMVAQVHDMVTAAIDGQCKCVEVIGNAFKIGNRDICKLYIGNGSNGAEPYVTVWTCDKPQLICHHSTHTAAQAILKALAKEAARFES